MEIKVGNSQIEKGFTQKCKCNHFPCKHYLIKKDMVRPEVIRRVVNLMELGVLVKKDEKLMISGKATFKWQSEKGVPPEIFKEIVNNYLYRKEVENGRKRIKLI